MVSCDWCKRCEKSSKRILILASAFVGLSVLALQSGDFIAGLGNVGLIGPSIAGGILLVVSFIGCAGVLYRNRCLLIIYFLILFVMSAFVISAGVILLFFVDDVNNVDGAASTDFVGQIEGQINDYIVAVFNECCATPQDGIEKLLGCNEAAPGEACFTFIETYQDALDRVRNTGLCTVFENTNIEIEGQEVPIVGLAEDGGCAGGDGQLFVQEFSKLIQNAVKPAGGVILAVGILLFLTSIFSLVMVFQEPDTYDFNFRKTVDMRRQKRDKLDFERGVAPRDDYRGKRNRDRDRYIGEDYDEGYYNKGGSLSGLDNPRYRYY